MSGERRAWLITGIIVPLVVGLFAAIPLWIEVIHPRIDNNNEPKATVVPTIAATATPDATLLGPAVLTLEDLPPGWVQATNKLVEEPCSLHITRQGVVGSTIAYEATDAVGSGYVYQEVALHIPGEAASIINYVATVLDTCTTSTATSPDGQRVASTVVPLVFPQLGDQSLAFREIVPGTTDQYTTDTVLVRRRDYLLILSITNLGTIDSTFDQFVEAVARTADVKLAGIIQ